LVAASGCKGICHPKEEKKIPRERERERALPSKGTAESCPGQTHPQTPLFS